MVELLPGGAFAAIGIGLLAWADVVRFRERRLLHRLVPVPARVIDQGTTPYTEVFVSTGANGERTERRDIAYHRRYAYRIDGAAHEGSVTAAVPVFTDAQMPPNVITVFYDRANPAVSRLSAVHVAPKARLLTIFGCVVVAVAGLIVLISNIDVLIDFFSAPAGR